ncbi:MAG: hypothetical protein EBY16_10360 [Gammaproteobacteria bacterium]|nr:hypothetical protein [Gammaproteobacteria bacterium]
MELLQEDSPAKIYQWLENEQDWVVLDQDYSGKSADCLTKQKRRTLSSKMCLVYFPQIKEKIWPQFLKRWSSAGIASDTGCLMLNTSEFPNEGVECSLSGVLETQGSHLKKYWLSPKAAQGILRRANKRGKVLPERLQKALEIQSGGMEVM